MSTAEVVLWANGMDVSWVDGRGIKSWFGDWVSRGSQVSSKSSTFLRSEVGSVILLHLGGTFTQPKVSLSEMRMYNGPFQLIQVANWIAACDDKWCRR